MENAPKITADELIREIVRDERSFAHYWRFLTLMLLLAAFSALYFYVGIHVQNQRIIDEINKREEYILRQQGRTPKPQEPVTRSI